MTGADHLGGAMDRDRLTALFDAAPAHRRPIWLAVRDFGCAYAGVFQGPEPFRSPLPEGQPIIVLFGDDLEEAHGPNGFDLRSIHRLAALCRVAIIISGAPEPWVYVAATTQAAVCREHVLIIETRPEYEDAWIGFVQQVRPDAVVFLATPDLQGAAFRHGPTAGGVH